MEQANDGERGADRWCEGEKAWGDVSAATKEERKTANQKKACQARFSCCGTGGALMHAGQSKKEDGAWVQGVGDEASPKEAVAG